MLEVVRILGTRRYYELGSVSLLGVVWRKLPFLSSQLLIHSLFFYSSLNLYLDFDTHYRLKISLGITYRVGDHCLFYLAARSVRLFIKSSFVVDIGVQSVESRGPGGMIGVLE